jgi:hypothetical protein
MYGAFTQSGLPAYIMQLELWLTGWSETKITILLTVFVLFMLLSGILRIYGRLATSLSWVGGTDPNWVGPAVPDPNLMARLNRRPTNTGTASMNCSRP